VRLDERHRWSRTFDLLHPTAVLRGSCTPTVVIALPPSTIRIANTIATGGQHG
jgi:hypothetical protein